jgi:hypothetical protein
MDFLVQAVMWEKRVKILIICIHLGMADLKCSRFHCGPVQHKLCHHVLVQDYHMSVAVF